MPTPTSADVDHSPAPAGLPSTPHAPPGALLLVFSVVFIDLLGFGMVLPLLPIYARQFTGGYSAQKAGWILGLLMTCFSVMQFLFAPLWGRISDRIGRRPVLLVSLTGSMCFYGLFGLATLWGSLAWMFVARIGAGIAGATIPTAQAYIADVTTRQQRARGMAAIGAAFGLGFTFGPLIGALALVTAGEAGVSPWPGYTAAVLSAVALTFCAWKLPESRHAGAPAEARGMRWSAIAGVLSIRSIGLLLASSFVGVFALAALEATLPLALASFLGVERGGYQVLLAFAFIGLVQTLVQGLLVRRLAKRIPEAALAAIGLALSIAGYLVLGLVADPVGRRVGWLLSAAAVVVAGFGFLAPALQSLLTRRGDPERQGVLLGIGESVSAMARITGVMAGVRLYYAGPTLPFWSAAGLMILATLLIGAAIRGGRDWSGADPALRP